MTRNRQIARLGLVAVLVFSLAAPSAWAEAEPTTVRVFYATNRNVVEANGRPANYGTQISRLSFGSVTVSLPPNHQCGTLERPNPFKWDLIESAERHVVITKVTPMAGKEFKQSLAQAVQQSGSQDVLVFVHGHSTRFGECVRQAAQLACDLQFEGTVVVFTWPTQGTICAESYRNDELSVSASVPAMQRLFRILRRTMPESRIHVLAHSLGCRLVASAAVAETAVRESTMEPWLDQVVLAAADVDTTSFAKVIWPSLQQSARHVTVYCSTADAALGFSKKWSFGTNPLGLGVCPQIARIEGITVVETSDLKCNPLSFGHCYHRESPAVIGDMRTVFNGAGPQERGLTFHQPDEASAGWWRITMPTTEKATVASSRP